MFSEKDVKYIAGLSRIHLEANEILLLTKNLEEILQYVDKLKTLDVTKVEPTSHVLPLQNVFRKDQVKPSLGQQKALQIAVEQHKASFKVPRVIE